MGLGVVQLFNLSELLYFSIKHAGMFIISINTRFVSLKNVSYYHALTSEVIEMTIL